MKLKDALRERDEASATALKLAELVRDLIGKLRNTRFSQADREAQEAEISLKKLIHSR